ncbi:C-3 sterol dehydrogenase C-4 decarboxylase protein [Rutstroemia sp. NJR-2017a BVV2]|nr:C-3 sterol dehydrogenase C-4 decarboxylase protein [Rutstroemia sp. NJR-2017a BVV2]
MASDDNLGVVLIAGGCGYVGSKLVKLLQEKTSSEIHVMSRSPKDNIRPGVQYHAGDIADRQRVTEILEKVKPQVIFHTVSPAYTEPERVLRRVNIDGTRVLLECAAESKSVRAVVYTSSDSAVVQAPGVKLTEEIAELYTESSKCNVYEKTKAIADAMVLAANNPPTLYTATLRVPSMYGEDNDKVMGVLLGGVKKKQHAMQVGDNKRTFEFLYIESACMAHIQAAKALLAEAAADSDGSASKKNGKVNGEAFFVSDGVNLPYFTWARKIYAFAGHPVADNEVKSMPYGLVWTVAFVSEWLYWVCSFGTKAPNLRQGAIEYLAGGSHWDISKAKERLGFEPVADQDEVLKRVTEYEVKRLGI